jgi:hypothetical protein
MIANVAAEIVHTPAARPSTPSVKLRTFITATIPNTVSAAPPTSPSSMVPTSGIEISSTVTPESTGTSAAATWPRSFTAGGRSIRSSTAPISAIAAAPSKIPRVSASSGTNRALATRTAARIASPPR